MNGGSAHEPSAPNVLGIVLAAGASTRFAAGSALSAQGVACKALAQLDGETLLARSLNALERGGCRALVCVLGQPHAAAIALSLRGRTRQLFNPDPARGMSSSLQVALADPVVREASAVVVALVDHPRVQTATVASLIAHWQRSNALVVRPSFGGRHGHPYLVDRRFFDVLLNARPGADLRPLLAPNATAFAVADAGILEDLDERAQLDALADGLK